MYFQSQGGAVTYGTWNASGLSANGTLTASGNISGADISGSNLTSRGGGISLSGWGGNPAISVIFLNAAQNHYMYHDGTNVSFSGVSSVYAGNGRLWGSNDFAAPTSGVTDTRLVFGGDVAGTVPGTVGVTIVNEWAGGVITGWSWTYLDTGDGFQLKETKRLRYLQILKNGSWVTVGYA